LNRFLNGSTESRSITSGQAADVVVALYLRRVAGAALYDVAVQGALDEEGGVLYPSGLLLEGADEFLPDDLALPLRVGDAREPVQKPPPRLDVHQRHVRVLAERFHDLLGLLWRNSPWSTNTHVRLSPMARCTSIAAVEESTPPDRPQIARLSPTCSRILSTASVMMFTGVQFGAEPHASNRKVLEDLHPVTCVPDSG
jgi:hypothetical protein